MYSFRITLYRILLSDGNTGVAAVDSPVSTTRSTGKYMFDEWRTRFSPLSNRWIRLARGPPGLARTFSDWGTAGPVPSRDRADGFEYVGRGGRVCANCSRPSPTARCRRRQPKPNSEGTSSARRADSMRPATGVAGSRRRFSQRGRPPHRSLHWPKPRSRRRGGRCSRASPTNSSSGLEAHLDETAPAATIDRRSGAVRVTTPAYDPPSLDATVGIATGGTVDGPVADEAELVCLDAGATVDRVDDIGVAALTRTLDQLDRFREADVLVVAAGREGAPDRRRRPRRHPGHRRSGLERLRSRRGRRGGTRRDAPVVYRAVGRQHRRGVRRRGPGDPDCTGDRCRS